MGYVKRFCKNKHSDCKALHRLGKNRWKCDLGYIITLGAKYGIRTAPIYYPKPVVPCPKPLTYKDYLSKSKETQT